jgi:hypothetical protein
MSFPKNMLVFLLGFVLPVIAMAIFYFTTLKKKICSGDLHNCPAAGIDICVKSGTSDTDWQKMCTNLTPSGFGPLKSVASCVENLMAHEKDCVDTATYGGACYNEKCKELIYKRCCNGMGDKEECIQNKCFRN